MIFLWFSSDHDQSVRLIGLIDWVDHQSLKSVRVAGPHPD